MSHFYGSVVLVHDFHVFGTPVRPDETNSVLVVDPNAVLTISVAPQSLQAIAWRHPKILQPLYRFQDLQLAPRCTFDALKAPNETIIE